MSKFIGRLVELGIAREASRGAGATPSIWVGKQEFNLYDQIDEARDEDSVGVLADSLGKEVVEKYAGGSISGNLSDTFLGYLLLNILGSVSTTGSGTYTHAFSIDNVNNHPSLCLAVNDPDRAERYRLAMLDNLELVAELGEYVKYSSEIISKASQVVGGGYTPDYSDAGNKFAKQHVKVKVADNLAGLSAASTLALKRLALTISKNAIRDSSLGTVQPEDILNRQISIEGEIELNYTDTTFRDYMLNGSYKAMEIVLERSATSKLTLRLPKIDFSSFEPDRTNDEIVKQTLTFRASRDVANGDAVISTAELVNTYSSYAS